MPEFSRPTTYLEKLRSAERVIKTAQFRSDPPDGACQRWPSQPLRMLVHVGTSYPGSGQAPGWSYTAGAIISCLNRLS